MLSRRAFVQSAAAGIALAWGPPPPPLVSCDALAPGGRRKKFARVVNQQGGGIAAVGHMPDIAELAGWLIGSRKVRLDFSKAGIACISLADHASKGEGVLEWLITEAWLS